MCVYGRTDYFFTVLQSEGVDSVQVSVPGVFPARYLRWFCVAIMRFVRYLFLGNIRRELPIAAHMYVFVHHRLRDLLLYNPRWTRRFLQATDPHRNASSPLSFLLSCGSVMFYRCWSSEKYEQQLDDALRCVRAWSGMTSRCVMVFRG